MKFSSTWSVIAANILITAVAQPAGRFLYTQKEGRYRLGFDVYDDKSVAIIFDTRTEHFIDGRYPLIDQGSSNYFINFTGTVEGVRLWYREIKRIAPDVFFRDGDLTNFTYSPYGFLTVGFEGKKLDLYGYGFPLVAGKFMYVEGSSPFLRINYTIHAEGLLDVQFECFHSQMSTMSFGLTQSADNAYNLEPPSKIEELRRKVKHMCPWLPVEPYDLREVGFATLSTVLIVLENRLFRLKKIEYVHAEGRKYRLAFDVFSDKTVGLIFDTPTKHFIDGYYPLTHQGGGTYAVNFNVYPDIVIRNGDLTTLTYTTGDTLYVMLGGKRVDLIRQGHTLQAGRFVYKLGEFPFPTLHISYTVYSNGELDVQFICTDIASPTVLFTLTEDEKSLKYKSYKLAPLHNVEKLKRDIRLACPGTPLGGMYLYAEDVQYRLALDIREDKTVVIMFDTPTSHFIAGYYALTRQGGLWFALNFDEKGEGVSRLYRGIRSIYPDVVFQERDLTTFSFVTADILYVMFGGRRLDLLRQVSASNRKRLSTWEITIRSQASISSTPSTLTVAVM
ncbi:hypothetical protein FOL47_005566 [Perkinsus chesapeaki]|uniref:Uncharacterized protein n=1 Tax=Perkinsus chesapeaki TaxID=330153 RepID=A0A7J6LWW9_PERCH|nr:hypothetical protein FOL47_005566 [Perkinsus chesapeaki]